MQHPALITDERVAIRSLWIERAHDHRLVELIQIRDRHHVRVQAVRGLQQEAPSYLGIGARLASNYQLVRR